MLLKTFSETVNIVKKVDSQKFLEDLRKRIHEDRMFEEEDQDDFDEFFEKMRNCSIYKILSPNFPESFHDSDKNCDPVS